MTISNAQKELYDTAREAITHSYSPHSKFAVGAALLTENGDRITGCNIENASFGLTMCAERVAVFKAVSDGHKNFKAIAIACESAANCPPCGACLQVLLEFAPEITIIYPDNSGDVIARKISEMLPHGFTLEA